MRITPSTIALLVTLCIPHGLADPPPGWGPLRSTCVDPGYFVNAHDCTRFFRCVDHSTSEGRLLLRYDFDCPHGTVFDEGAKVCVHARDGICGGGWGPSSPGGWSPPPPPPPPPHHPPKGWGGWSTSHHHLDHGWSKPAAAGGWSPPTKGAKRPVVIVKGGWGSKGSRGPLQLVQEFDDEDDIPAWDWGQPSSNTNSYWSFTPGSSYVVVYDARDKKKRSLELP